MGYDIVIAALVLIQQLTGSYLVYEHGWYNLLRVAGAPVYQPSHWEIPFGAPLSLSGCKPGPGRVRHSRPR